jgi:G patch domain-containing protein 1
LSSIDDGAEDVEMDAEAGKHTFAPRDTKLVVYEGKEGREGLGYEKGKGMGRLPGIAGPCECFTSP